MAIAFDAVTNASHSSPVSPQTFSSASTSASATIGIVGIGLNATTDTVSSVTWGGSSMTKITETVVGTQTISVWAIFSPASGVQTISITYGTWASSDQIFAASYTGTDVATMPSNKSSTSTASGTSLSNNITTAQDNSWIVNYAFERSSNTIAYTAGATKRTDNNGGTGGSRAWGDTNASITPVGTVHTDSFNWTGTADGGILQLEIFPPATAGGTIYNSNLPTMNVG